MLCPSCSCTLLHLEDGPFGDAFIYATLQQMRELRLTCENISCPIFIEGRPHLDGWIAEDKTPGNEHLQSASRTLNIGGQWWPRRIFEYICN